MDHRYSLLFTAAAISFSFEREKGTIDTLSPLHTPMVLIKHIVKTKLFSPFITLNAMREAEILYIRTDLMQDRDFS